MVRLAIGLAPVLFALFVYGFVNLLMTPDRDCRRLPKWAWLPIVLLLPPIGSALWLTLGRHGDRRLGVPASPPMPSDPEADEAYQRRLRERAQTQRWIADAERERQQRQTGEDPPPS